MRKYPFTAQNEILRYIENNYSKVFTLNKFTIIIQNMTLCHSDQADKTIIDAIGGVY